MESLIREIDPDEKDNDLNNIKAKITGRKKIVEVKSKKSTSRLGKYLSLSALIIPLGSALLGKVNYDNLTLPLSNQAGHINYLFLFGMLFCMAPLWVLAFWRICGDKDSNHKISWEFFSTDTREDYTQDITEDGERTSIEFEDHFTSIIKVSMAKGLIDKCVVVIDNLDRVDPGQAKNIWSTLQTFFQRRSCSDGRSSWADKLWFLIPFDHQGFLRIWGASNVDAQLGNSFLKKCFQIIAEVPMPVMSEWAKYADKVIREALSEWPAFELEKSIETYVRYASRLEQSPTPRDMKVFANQLGLLGSMWGRKLSVESMCLYVLLKERFDSNDIRQRLLNGSLLSSYQTEQPEYIIHSEIAGLLFGVRPSKGIQLLLGPEIQNAFKDGNGERLQDLTNQHPEAFWIVYEATRSSWFPTNDHTDELKVNFVAAIFTGLNMFPNKIARDVINITNVILKSLPNFDLSRTNIADTIEKLIILASDKTDILTHTNSWLSDSFSSLVATIGTEKFKIEQVENISLVLHLLSAEGVQQKRLVYPKLTQSHWKEWLDQLDDYGLVIPNILPSKNTITNIAAEVGFSSANINFDSLSYLSRTYDLYRDSNEWVEVSQQLATWFNIQNRNHQSEVAYNFALKMMTSDNKKLKDAIIDCVKASVFWVSSAHSNPTENLSLPIIAAAVFGYELQKSTIVSSNVKDFWQENYSESDQKLIFDRMKSLGLISVIWKLCTDDLNKRAIGFIKNTEDKVIFSHSEGANRIDEINWVSEQEAQKFASKLIKEGSYESNKRLMDGDPQIYAHVYEIFYKVSNSDVCNYIDSQISAITKDKWLSCIKSNSPLVKLVKDKNPAFTDALTIYLKDLICGNIQDGEKIDSAELITELLEKSADLKRKLAPAITKEFFSTAKDSLSDEQFDALKPHFGNNLNKLDEVVLMDKINQWIDKEDEKKIDWLFSQKFNSPKVPLESMVSRVSLNISSDSDSTRRIAEKITTKFNLKIDIATELSDEH